MTHSNNILVLGGTGKTGRRVVERLKARNLSVRVGSRYSEMPFDWNNRDTWDPVLQNIASVYIAYQPDLAVSGVVDDIRVIYPPKKCTKQSETIGIELRQEDSFMGSKGSRYKEEQIIRILKEVDSGISVAEVCRKYGVADQTVYCWRNKYGGLETSELQRLRELEAENSRLKRIVAQQVLDIDVLKEVVSKKW